METKSKYGLMSDAEMHVCILEDELMLLRDMLKPIVEKEIEKAKPTRKIKLGEFAQHTDLWRKTTMKDACSIAKTIVFRINRVLEDNKKGDL